VGRHTHLPVFVENDVNTLTLTEQLFGVGRRYNDFIVVTIGRGIGMGIVIDGRLYPGANGGAGELGHTTLAGDVISEHPGYLEELAADPGVLRAVNAGLPNDSPPYAILEEVIAAAQAGVPAARVALAASGERVGIAIANAVNLLAPELLIVSGEGVAAGQYRLDPMVAALRRHCFDGLFDDLEIVIRQTDDQAWARGAASLVMSKVFAAPALQVGIN
jgi:predicted NBD/HSP70 family sugar kinase